MHYTKAAKKTSVFPVFYDGHGQLLVRINKESIFSEHGPRGALWGSVFSAYTLLERGNTVLGGMHMKKKRIGNQWIGEKSLNGFAV